VTDVSAGGSDNPLERAQLVALELLRRTIADLPGAIARNANDAASGGDFIGGGRRQQQPNWGAHNFTGGPGGGGGRPGGGNWVNRRLSGAADTGGDAGNMLATKFTTVLGPLAVFGQVLNSNVGGFQVLGKVIQVIATLLAGFLLPAVATIAAALLEWADEMEGEVMAAAEKFGEFVMGTLLPAIEFLADVISGTVDVFVWLGETIGDVIGWFGDLIAEGKPAGEGVEDDAAMALADFLGLKGMDGARERMATGKDPEAEPAPADAPAPKRFDRSGAMADVIASLRLSMGPKASFAGLADVGKSAQMAALNADPIDQRMLRIAMKQVDMLERIHNKMAGKGAERPVYGTGEDGAGDFSGGGGAGGGWD
jgi:hypothetical protein